MNTLQDTVRTVFLAPGEAALEAERGYRKIWADWLTDTMNRIDSRTPNAPNLHELVLRQMPLAPIMKISGQIELGLTMRIASVQGGGAQISLGAGPIGISGSYSRRETQESVMTIHGTFTVTNTETDLVQYLSMNNIVLAKPDDVKNAIALLSATRNGQE